MPGRYRGRKTRNSATAGSWRKPRLALRSAPMSKPSESKPTTSGSNSATADGPGEVELRLSDVEAGLASLPRAKVARAISLVGGALVLGMVAYRWHEGRDRVTLAVVGALLLALLFSNRNPARKIAKKVYDALPAEARRIGVQITESGIVLRSSGAESELAWESIWKVAETREVMVVFVSRENAQILPKRAFSESELSRLRELSARKITPHSEPFFTPELQKRLFVWLAVVSVVWTAWYFYSLYGKR